MGDINSFHEGDIVAFKIDTDVFSDDKKICVVEKKEKDNKIVISKHGETKEVSPFELLTAQEVKNIEKEIHDELNS